MIEIPCQQLIAIPSVSDHLSRSTNYRALSITVLKQFFFAYYVETRLLSTRERETKQKSIFSD